MSSKRSSQKRSPSSTSNYSIILLVFFSSRLMLLLAYPPESLVTYSDYHYYFNSADMSRLGYYPFLHYWSEYPPIFPYLNLAIYHLAGQTFKNHIFILATFLLLMDGLNLNLIYRLGLTLRGPARAIQLAWIYTGLLIPFLLTLINYDAFTTFFILLGLYALVKSRNKLLAVALALGTMVKILPFILIGTIWRAKGFKSAVTYGLITVIFSVLLFAPFAWANPTMTKASLLSQGSKSSYQTVWALIDNNYTTGSFGPLDDRLDPEMATQPLHNPPRLPSWLTLIPFALLGLFILTRPRPDTGQKAQQDIITFTTLAFLIFLLWSPGWSPQWQIFLIPLILLAFPEKEAVLFIIVLGFINFLEWPVMLSRGLNQLLPITIIARTGILMLMIIQLYRQLTQSAEPIIDS